MNRKPRMRPKNHLRIRNRAKHRRSPWEPGVTGRERSILDTLPLPTAALAGSNHILRYVNSAFCRLACKTKDELVGKAAPRGRRLGGLP